MNMDLHTLCESATNRNGWGSKGILILAATNRPDIIDPAILHPGRFDTVLYVGFPEQADRVEILKVITKNGTTPLLAHDVDFNDLAAKTNGYTGADLSALVKQASILSISESLKNPEQDLTSLCVCKENFEMAINCLCPSVSDQDRKFNDASIPPQRIRWTTTLPSLQG